MATETDPRSVSAAPEGGQQTGLAGRLSRGRTVLIVATAVFAVLVATETLSPLQGLIALAVLVMLAMLISSADRRTWNSRLVWIWGIGSFATFLLMFGQIVIPLGLILFVALGVGGLGILLRGGIAQPAELNGWRALAAIGAIGLVLRLAGILPA